MGSLFTRQVEDRLDTKREELMALSCDLDAFVWEIEQALRSARHGDPDAETLQRLDVRAAELLTGLDKSRHTLPPRLSDVLSQRRTVGVGGLNLEPPGAFCIQDEVIVPGVFDGHRYMK